MSPEEGKTLLQLSAFFVKYTRPSNIMVQFNERPWLKTKRTDIGALPS